MNDALRAITPDDDDEQTGIDALRKEVGELRKEVGGLREEMRGQARFFHWVLAVVVIACLATAGLIGLTVQVQVRF